MVEILSHKKAYNTCEGVEESQGLWGTGGGPLSGPQSFESTCVDWAPAPPPTPAADDTGWVKALSRVLDPTWVQVSAWAPPSLATPPLCPRPHVCAAPGSWPCLQPSLALPLAVSSLVSGSIPTSPTRI